MAALHGHDGWLASCPFGFMVLDREAGEFFLRTKDAVFPGLTIAELFGIADGPLHEEIVRNIININGADHRRLRNLVNPALVAPCRRPLPAGDAPVSRGAAGDDPGGRPLRVHLVVREAVPVAGDRRGDGRTAERRARGCTTGRTGSSASSTPNSLLTERARIEQAVSEFYVSGRRADRASGATRPATT